MATTPYLAHYAKRNTYRYFRRTEPDLIPWLGTHRRSPWLGSDKEAAKIEVRRLTVEDDTFFRRLRATPEAERDRIAEVIDPLGLPGLQDFVADVDEIRQAWAAWDHTKPATLVGGQVLTLEETMRWKLDMMRPPSHYEQQARDAVAATPAPAPVAEFSIDGLLAIWREARTPKRWDNHQRTIALLKKILGKDTDYRKVDGDTIGRFRDALSREGKGYLYQKKHLEQASAMFSAAIDKRAYKGANPCEGIKPDGKADDDNRDTKAPFSGAQLRHILEAAEREQFGDNGHMKRHEAVMWVLRALAFNGERPNEVLLMQKGDVRTVDGVPVMVLSENCCATGVRLDKKSIKNRQSWRTIPLHPALYDADYQRKHGLTVCDFRDFAKGDKSEFLFECFPWNASKYRRGWFDTDFSPFIRDVCGVEPAPGEKLSLTSMRLRFHDVMDHSSISAAHQRILTGHAAPDVHEKYKRGKNLKLLAADVARIDVLAD